MQTGAQAFQVTTSENWNAVWYDTVEHARMWGLLYFLLLMVVGVYLLFNLFIAVRAKSIEARLLGFIGSHYNLTPAYLPTFLPAYRPNGN